MPGDDKPLLTLERLRDARDELRRFHPQIQRDQFREALSLLEALCNLYEASHPQTPPRADERLASHASPAADARRSLNRCGCPIVR